MANTATGTRISIQLDPRMALEAILLSRLQLMPTKRRQEWLRGLLLQGFREECQALRGHSEGRGTSTLMSYVPRLHSRMNHSQPEQEVCSMKLPTTTPSANKPFAALGKVIG